MKNVALEAATLPVPLLTSTALLTGFTVADYVLWGSAVMITLNIAVKLFTLYTTCKRKD